MPPSPMSFPNPKVEDTQGHGHNEISQESPTREQLRGAG